MKTLLYTGVPGCGKTFRAIVEAKSFVIAVPCRQLAYEIYWDYPMQISRIDTGEVHMGDSGHNQVCVYENLPFGVIDEETLIVDEAHYLNDRQRGGALFEKILLNLKAGKRIVLLTATDTLSDEVREMLEVEEVELQPFAQVPAKVEIDFDEFCAKVKAGMSAIVFTKFTPGQNDIDYYADKFGVDASNIGMLSAQTPTFERVEAQLKFKTGKLQVVVATNVLAQGLNFPAQGVMIEHNEWDDWEIVSQKVGRVARPLFGINEGYYCLSEMPTKYKKRGLPENTERQACEYIRPSGVEVDISGWGFMAHEVPYNLAGYKSFKYSYRFLRILAERHGNLEAAEQAALDFLIEQSAKLRELLAKRESGVL
jgi:hypothetical protein